MSAKDLRDMVRVMDRDELSAKQKATELRKINARPSIRPADGVQLDKVIGELDIALVPTAAEMVDPNLDRVIDR